MTDAPRPPHRPEAPGLRVVNHGCRLNIAEGEALAAAAAEAGASNLGGIIVHNSCSVTAEALRSVRQAIRRSARENPGARIVVTGCAAHTDGAALAAMEEVHAVIGNQEKLSAEGWIDLPDFGVSTAEKLRVADWPDVATLAPHMQIAGEPAARDDGGRKRARAFLAIQNGCDHACTFCIIPNGRGPSRSVPMGVIVESARRLVDNGSEEIVLTGVDLTSWGGDLPGGPRLGDVVQTLLRHLSALPRLRLSSIDSIEADPALMDALAEPRFMPHLHLSLQHGHDLILKRMRRRHLREDAIAFCEEARARRPGLAIGADLIAGFPTETAEHHAASMSLVEEAGIAHLHVFPFSVRHGTPAARRPQLDGRVVRERAKALREVGGVVLRRHLEARVGTSDEVVVHHGHDANGRQMGLTRDFCRTAMIADARPHASPGHRLAVRIAAVEGDGLLAHPVG